MALRPVPCDEAASSVAHWDGALESFLGGDSSGLSFHRVKATCDLPMRIPLSLFYFRSGLSSILSLSVQALILSLNFLMLFSLFNCTLCISFSPRVLFHC